jgi:hypothetical protein
MRIHRVSQTSITASNELRRLLVYCQTFCSADCCKSKAFDTGLRVLSDWIRGEHINRTGSILKELSQLVETIEGQEAKVRFDISKLESEWDRAEALLFFSTLRERFEEAVSQNSA